MLKQKLAKHNKSDDINWSLMHSWRLKYNVHNSNTWIVNPIVIVFLLLAQWNVYTFFGPAGFAQTAYTGLSSARKQESNTGQLRGACVAASTTTVPLLSF
jgi:hypothetical protein